MEQVRRAHGSLITALIVGGLFGPIIASCLVTSKAAAFHKDRIVKFMVSRMRDTPARHRNSYVFGLHRPFAENGLIFGLLFEIIGLAIGSASPGPVKSSCCAKICDTQCHYRGQI